MRIRPKVERPIGLALDPTGRLLIAEERAERVVRVEANGSRTAIVAGVKQPRWLAALAKPVGLARDRLGALYLTTKELDLLEDHSKRAVAKLSPAAVVTLYAQNLAKPQGVAFDGDGSLYVAAHLRGEGAGPRGERGPRTRPSRCASGRRSRALTRRRGRPGRC